MHNRYIGFLSACTLVGLALLWNGCGQPGGPDAGAPPAANSAGAAPAPLFKLHWLGKKALAADTNAATLLGIWNLPESQRLEAQTLDKLASAPWRLWSGAATPVSNAPVDLLRPLLADLVQEESYWESRELSSGGVETVLAVRLPADRAAAWASNLPPVLVSLVGDRENSAGAGSWSLHRSNDWTLVSFSSGGGAQSAVHPALATVLTRLAGPGLPYESRPTNYWFELAMAGPATGALAAKYLPLATNGPALQLVAFGEGDTVRARGTLDFPQPLALPVPAWTPPTNLMFGPLVSFSAVRGLQSWLEAQPFWAAQQLGAAPNQMFFWAQGSAPWLHFLAALSPNAEKQFLALKDFTLATINPALAPNRTGDFAWLTNENQVVWKGVPFFNPAFARQGDWLTGGFVPNAVTNRSIPQEYLQQLARGTNLIYYDWEHTGPQVQSWIQIGQLLRMAFSRAQLPATNAVIPWLQKVGPDLGFSATTLTWDGARRLSLARSGTVGFNSVELHLLMDWLASPDFPAAGLHTFTAKREFIMDRMRRPR